MTDFNPVGVGVHCDPEDRPTGQVLDLHSIIAVDAVTEKGHPAIWLGLNDRGDPDNPGSYTAVITLRQFLQTVKLVMDGYPQYVRELFISHQAPEE